MKEVREQMKSEVTTYLQNFGGSFVPDFGMQTDGMNFGDQTYN